MKRPMAKSSKKAVVEQEKKTFDPFARFGAFLPFLMPRLGNAWLCLFALHFSALLCFCYGVSMQGIKACRKFAHFAPQTAAEPSEFGSPCCGSPIKHAWIFSLRLTNTTTFFALDRLWTSKKHTTTAMSEHKAAGCATFPFAVTTKPSYASLRPGTLLQEPVVASASPFNTSLLCSPDSRLNPRVARGVPPPRRR